MSEHTGELGAGLRTENHVSAEDCRWNGRGRQEQGKHLGLVLSLSLFGPGPQHFAGPGTLGKSLKVLWTLALPSVKWDCSPPHRAALALLQMEVQSLAGWRTVGTPRAL